MTTRIGLVPYKVGQEPEGMVSSLDPGSYDDNGSLVFGLGAIGSKKALADAVKVAKRDPWEEWRESVDVPWGNTGSAVMDRDGSLIAGHGLSRAQLQLIAAAPALVEALRNIAKESPDQRAVDTASCALRKAGAPVDEPESAEDVPELWVSRDDAANPGTTNLWVKGKPIQNPTTGRWWPMRESDGSEVPQRLADTLALKPGDCRRVTRDEYERFFRPVLDLPPSERYAALERMVP